jgi:hypothetical protein
MKRPLERPFHFLRPAHPSAAGKAGGNAVKVALGAGIASRCGAGMKAGA